MGNNNEKNMCYENEIWTIGDNNCGQQLNDTTKHVMCLEKIANVKNKRIQSINTIVEGFTASTIIVHQDGELVFGRFFLHTDEEDYNSDDRNRIQLMSQGIAAKHVFVIKQDDKLTIICN
eukprot:68123_1